MTLAFSLSASSFSIRNTKQMLGKEKGELCHLHGEALD